MSREACWRVLNSSRYTLPMGPLRVCGSRQVLSETCFGVELVVIMHSTVHRMNWKRQTLWTTSAQRSSCCWSSSRSPAVLPLPLLQNNCGFVPALLACGHITLRRLDWVVKAAACLLQPEARSATDCRVLPVHDLAPNRLMYSRGLNHLTVPSSMHDYMLLRACRNLPARP